MNKIFKVGLIGCGHISETYFRAEKYFNNIKIIKCADINHSNAVRCAKTYKIKALTVKELLKDKEVEIILNLTIPKAHYQVAKQALINGKHVYSEKPLAINFKDGKVGTVVRRAGRVSAHGASPGRRVVGVHGDCDSVLPHPSERDVGYSLYFGLIS